MEASAAIKQWILDQDIVPRGSTVDISEKPERFWRKITSADPSQDVALRCRIVVAIPANADRVQAISTHLQMRIAADPTLGGKLVNPARAAECSAIQADEGHIYLLIDVAPG